MFDPQLTNGQRSGQQLPSDKSNDIAIDFNICKIAGRCNCAIQVFYQGILKKNKDVCLQVSVDQTQSLTAGEETNMVLGVLSLRNTGTEAAVGNTLTIKINQKLYRFQLDRYWGICQSVYSVTLVFRGNCDQTTEEYLCSLPFLKEGGNQTFDLSVISRQPILPNETSVSMSLALESSCPGNETPKKV